MTNPDIRVYYNNNQICCNCGKKGAIRCPFFLAYTLNPLISLAFIINAT
jgi:hypothetical protein